MRPLRIAAVALVVATAAGPAAADCGSRVALRAVALGIAGRFRCERQRIASPDAPCTPPAALACAGDLNDQLVALAGLAGDAIGARGPGRARACQRAVAAGVARAAVDRVRSVLRDVPAPRAARHAREMLRRVEAACRVTVHRDGHGAALPRAGAPCDAVLPRAGERVDAGRLAACLDRAVDARLEPVLRRWLKPSIVLVLTDDQPASMLWPMQTVNRELVGHGVSFTDVVATTPLCAPGRASILTGRYAHGHGVLGNLPPFGAAALDESSTIATWLHDAGYRTSLVGKYVNGYGVEPTTPPGWDDWHAFIGSGYFDYRLIENGGFVTYGASEREYLTDVLATKAVDFIRSAGDDPFFLYFAPFAPHVPATPAPRHAGRFAGTPPWRPPSWNEADVGDKPAWVRNQVPLLSADDVLSTDALHERMLESLLAVDEAVATILRALDETGRTNDTLVLFTSDNGLSLGEHRIVGKQCPYEECMRVPLVVRYPRWTTSARTDARPVANIDLAPTWTELAGTVPATPVDGTSLARLFDGSAAWRRDLLVESFSLFPPTWAAVRDDRYKYVEYLRGGADGHEVELYDVAADPSELESRHADPAYAAVRAALAARLRVLDPGWTQPVP